MFKREGCEEERGLRAEGKREKGRGTGKRREGSVERLAPG